MDAFVQNTSGASGNKPLTRGQCDSPARNSPADDFAVMDYYDSNTVTGQWNYAQHFAMSDNSFGTTYGPSTPGALNVTAGNTFPTLCATHTGRAAPGGVSRRRTIRWSPPRNSVRAEEQTSPAFPRGHRQVCHTRRIRTSRERRAR